MGVTTVRISERAHGFLGEIARQDGLPLTAVLEKAIDEYRRRRFLEGIGEGYEELREDPAQWRAVLAERAQWDATLADGLSPALGGARPCTKRGASKR